MHRSLSFQNRFGRVLLDTYDPDEARQLVSAVYCPHTLSVHRGETPFHAMQDEVNLGEISMHRLSYGATTEVVPEALESWILVSTPQYGRLKVSSDGETRVVTTGDSVVLDAFRKFRLTFDNDCLLQTFRFERRFVEQTLAEVHGADTPLPARFGLAGPKTPRDAGTWRAVARLVAEQSVEAGTETAHPLLQQQLARTAVIALAETHPFLNATGPRTRRPPSPRTVRRVIDMVEANPEHPFSVAELATAAGVSPRALQEAFRKYMGTTPMGFVRDIRLRKAHDELISGSSSTVAEIAYRWGFGNLGRFARSYQEKFGQSPSLSLRGCQIDD